ncbi:MAG TPA: hypothetical protein VME24_12010 [Alphaproteobacteria bacterium]|nr:hypothetical protein [Alphaproteobacteria bacterium]
MKTRANPFTIYDLRFTRPGNRRLPHHSRAAAGPAGSEIGYPAPDTCAGSRDQQLAAADLVSLVLERAVVLGWTASTIQRFNVSTIAIL